MAAQNLGLAEMELNRPGEAAKALAIAVAADPEDYETRFHLGVALWDRAESPRRAPSFPKSPPRPRTRSARLCARPR